VKQSHLPQFSKLKLPPINLEQWKYTNPLTIMPSEVTTNPPPSYDTVPLPIAIDNKCYKVLLRNGKYDQDLSHLPPGVEISCRQTAPADSSQEYFEQLNQLTAPFEVEINIPSNLKIKTPLYLLNQLSISPSTLIQPRVKIVVGEGSKLAIHELHYTESQNNIAGYSNSLTKITAGNNSKVEHLLSQLTNSKFHSLTKVVAKLGANATLNSYLCSLGGEVAITQLDAKLSEEGAYLGSYALYNLGKEQHHDFQTTITHQKPHTSSQQLFKGVMDDHAHGIFTGKVNIAPGAYQSDSSQFNHNMLLSNHAKADSRPTLDVLNDDVKCGHGATVGQLSDDSLFYCLGRGISLQRATTMLRQAFLLEVVNKVESTELKRELATLLAADKVEE
jgi:Fe-S cluster assembly protein SufD